MRTAQEKSALASSPKQAEPPPGTPAFEAYLSRKRIPNLDGLRGLAILLVLFHHVPQTHLAWISQFQHNAKHGVSLFFVISGYIVMTLMLREIRRSGAVDVPGFLWRRILRLWPLYYAILLGEAFLVFGLEVYSPDNRALFEDKLVCYALYCANWLETSGEGPFFVSWSLAVEEQFYLLLSLLFLCFRPGRVVAVIGALLAIKVLLVLGPFPVDLAALPWRVLLSYSEPILLGVLLACALDRRSLYSAFAAFAARRGVVLILLGLVVAFLLWGAMDHKSEAGSLIFYGLCALLVGAAAINDRLPMLGGQILSRIGLLSYGIYLMHMPVLSAVKRLTGDPTAVFLLTALVVTPIAWLSFRFFEEPIRQFGRPGRRSPGRDSRSAQLAPAD